MIGDQIDWEDFEQEDELSIVAENRATYGKQTPKTYQDLRAWQEGMDLVELCYRQSMDFPQDEIYGLRAQLRRAAVSVPCNIAEGWGRDSVGDVDHAVSFSGGSLREVETQLLIARRLAFGDQPMIQVALDKCGTVGGQIYRLREFLKKKRKLTRRQIPKN